MRDASRAPEADVEIITGDFDRPDTLDAAMRDIKTVILVSPAVPAQEIADQACGPHVVRVVTIDPLAEGQTVPSIRSDLMGNVATASDTDSAQWLAALRESGPDHDDAVARLHGLLLRVGLRHAHRRAAGTGLGGPELDDLAHQAASDALLSILRRLDSFRGESRFTTWAYKFVILEVPSKIGRHFWQRAETAWDDPDWTQLPAAFGASPEETLAAAELLGEVQFAVTHRLTDYQREIFVHVVVEGIPLDRLVARLGVTRNTIYKAVFDARRKIRKHLAETGNLPHTETKSS